MVLKSVVPPKHNASHAKVGSYYKGKYTFIMYLGPAPIIRP